MAGKIYIGIAGWSYPDWRGIVYPDSKTDQLKFISKYVDCVEINSTFYRPPDEKISMSWLEKTKEKEDFFFTAKLHRDFTHEGKIDSDMVKSFHTGLKPMLEAGKLKNLLAQFSFAFTNTEENRRHLAEIAENFSDSFKLAVEVRHKSWQDSDGLKFFEQLGVSVCNLDYPLAKNSFDMQDCTIGQFGYLRMHGRNYEKWFSKDAGRDETYDYYYSDIELEQIKERVEKISEAFEYLVVITNNHYRGAELANALELKVLISGKKTEVPQPLLKAYPQLSKIASNKPAGLFP
jgi:uncharacterized protein YecE (DUF72 family)